FSPMPAAGPVTADQRVSMVPAQSGPPQGAPAMQPPQTQQQPNMAPTVASPNSIPLGPPSQATKQPEEEDKTGGRSKKGFDVLINCSVVRGTEARGNRAAVFLDKILADCCDQIAKASGVDSFFALDVFKRRDALARMAPSVVEDIGNRTLVCEGVSNGASD